MFDLVLAFWQVKIWVVLAQADFDDTPEKFGNKNSKSWTDDEKRKDCKAFK
jgi:hypothetical protein